MRLLSRLVASRRVALEPIGTESDVTRSAFLVTMCCGLACLAGCGDETPPAEPDWAGLLVAAQSVTDPAQRLALLADLRQEALAVADHDRAARGVYLGVLAQLVALESGRGAGAAADRIREERRSAVSRFLAVDPGDGSVRGLLGYMMAQEGHFAESWELLLAGGQATDAADDEERPLLYFAALVAAMGRKGGDPEIDKPGAAAHASLFEALVARAEKRSVGRAHRLLITEGCARAQLSAGLLERAIRTVEVWEKLDPSSPATIELRQQIAAAKR